MATQKQLKHPNIVQLYEYFEERVNLFPFCIRSLTILCTLVCRTKNVPICFWSLFRAETVVECVDHLGFANWNPFLVRHVLCPEHLIDLDSTRDMNYNTCKVSGDCNVAMARNWGSRGLLVQQDPSATLPSACRGWLSDTPQSSHTAMPHSSPRLSYSRHNQIALAHMVSSIN